LTRGLSRATATQRSDSQCPGTSVSRPPPKRMAGWGRTRSTNPPNHEEEAHHPHPRSCTIPYTRPRPRSILDPCVTQRGEKHDFPKLRPGRTRPSSPQRFDKGLRRLDEIKHMGRVRTTDRTAAVAPTLSFTERVYHEYSSPPRMVCTA